MDSQNYVFKRASQFIYRNARPLDFARWQYHFENGSKEAVLNVLKSYQNIDGGFGHALEPDCWNVNSSPIMTWAATEIIKEIEVNDTNNLVIQGILNYLNSGAEFHNGIWMNTIPSNNYYPHAPWWSHSIDNFSSNLTDYNPTASLAGFILRFSVKDSDLFQKALHIAKEAIADYIKRDFLDDMHTVSCYISLYDYCIAANITELDIKELELKLKKQVQRSITHEKEKWEKEYVCKPSQFFNSVDSMFYKDNQEIAEYECEFIEKTQLSDGSWNIPWGWSDYLEEWHISKNWWKGNGILSNMMYLKGMGKL